MERSRLVALGMIAALVALVAVLPIPATMPTVSAASCTLASRYVFAVDRRPASGIFVLNPATGRSVTTDDTGRWSLDVGEEARAVVRIVVPNRLLDLRDLVPIPEGTVEVTYRLHAGCRASLEDVRQVVRVESAIDRFLPPALPLEFKPSQTTRESPLPAAVLGNAANVPWVGYFWLTAPVIHVGVCNIDDAATRSAAETALDRWVEAESRGLAWRLVRNDMACISGFPQPRLLIGRERMNDNSRVLAVTGAVDIDGAVCTVKAPVKPCWVMSALVVVNPAGFDSLSKDQQVATVLHEIGHGLGLGHTRGCGDSVMWFDTSCDMAPTLAPGADDIASLNELFTVTRQALLP